MAALERAEKPRNAEFSLPVRELGQNVIQFVDPIHGAWYSCAPQKLADCLGPSEGTVVVQFLENGVRHTIPEDGGMCQKVTVGLASTSTTIEIQILWVYKDIPTTSNNTHRQRPDILIWPVGS